MRTRTLAVRENERSQVARTSGGLRKAFAAYANNLAVDDAPLLTYGSAAADQDDGRTIDGCTALHVQAAAKVLGNHAALNEPTLVGATVALKHDDGAAVGSGAIFYVNAFTVRSRDLSPNDRERIGIRYVRWRSAGRQCSYGKPKHPKKSHHHGFHRINPFAITSALSMKLFYLN
jgi:hypothetical protein